MKKCFVCGKELTKENLTLNKQVYLYVCHSCRDSNKETKKVEEYLDSLADGFVCGCI